VYTIYADGTLVCSSKIEELAIINPVIKLEVNSAGTFTFTMPPQHPYYSLIQKKTTLIDVYRDDETDPLFEGICASDEVDFFKQKKIICEGELTFLNDSNLRPSHKVGLTSRQLLTAYINEHNSLVEAKKRFTVGQVTAKDDNDYITCFTNYQSTMTEIKEDLVDDIGGYLRTRHVNGVRYLDYLAESPRTNNQVIRLGENLLDISIGIDTDDLATVIIPLGETLETQSIEGLDERLNIKTAPADSMHPAGKDYVFSQSAVNSFGWIEKVVEWDDVTVVSNLVEKGKKYLQETQFENLVIEAKAIDLGLTSDEFQKFKLLDKVRVLSEPHGLDKYFLLSRMEIHLNNPEQDTITLGSKQANSLSAKSASANAEIMKRIEQMPTSNAVKSAIDNATALITGAEGGYVVITRNSSGQPIEIKIQDALNNPTKIWRWNVNGLGYSNDGGATYGLAMTMDGSIVASYITSGTMTADRVRGGELIVGGSGLAANGQITVMDSSNNVVALLNKFGLNVYNGYITGSTLNGNTINTISGSIGKWLMGDGYLMSFNGANESQSTRKVVMHTYVSSDNDYAFTVYTRDNTSDAWIAKFAITYAGNIVSQSAIDVYPTDDNYGMHVHGALSADAKLQTSNGSVIIDSNGDVTATNDCYFRGDVKAGQSLRGNAVYANYKENILQTQFGWLGVNAYEHPTPYYGDIGEGILNEQGECYIYFDDLFIEFMEKECQYQIFLQAYGDGKIYVAERKSDHFVVKGTENLRFGWEIKVVQKGMSGQRFDRLPYKLVDDIERSKQ